MVNGVVFFAVSSPRATFSRSDIQIGQSAIEAYLTAFQTHDFDPLPIVASAFVSYRNAPWNLLLMDKPTAAPYFASYILLQVAIQPFFEIFRFGVGLPHSFSTYAKLT